MYVIVLATVPVAIIVIVMTDTVVPIIVPVKMILTVPIVRKISLQNVVRMTKKKQQPINPVAVANVINHKYDGRLI